MAIQNDLSSRQGTRARRPRRGLPTRFETLEGRLLLAGDPPVAVGDSYVTPVGAELIISTAGVLANDTDAESDALTAIGVTDPSNGTLTLNADGSFKYTPNSGFHGTDSFTYKANDGAGDSNVATVTIKVNTTPVAVADSYSLTQGTPLTVAAPGLLANDTDAESDTLTTSLVDGPAHGSLTLNTDGSFTYTADSGYTGADSFTYKASDGNAQTGPTTVNLTVNAASTNRLPTSVADTYRTGVNSPLVIAASSGVLANDTDSDNDTLTAVKVSGPANGTVTLNADGSFTYTPTTAFRGTDVFTYKANDGKADGATTTVTIQVNNAPAASNDAYTTTNASTLNISVPGVLSNDTDTNGDSLTAVLVSPTTNGTLSLNANGSFTYTPIAGFVGTDSFVYQAFDGLTSSTSATVSIAVTSSSNATPVANNNSYTTTQGLAIQVNATNGVLGNDTDANSGDVLTASLVTGPTFGTLTLNQDGSFLYTPRAGFTGTDAFTYKASDSKAQSALATALLFVNATDQGGEDTITGSGSSGNDDGVVGDGLTTNTRPSFTGVAPAGFLVKLFARKSDAAAATQVGQVTAGSDGRYTVVAAALGDGSFAFSATATDPASTSGTPAATVALGSLTISASAPRVSGVTIAAATGKVSITFTSPLNGADPSAILAAANFSVTRGGRRVAITKVELTSATEITLTLRGGKIRPGSLRLLANSGGLKDASGRELDGEFTRSLPSGDGVAGGNFLAKLTLTRKGQTVRPIKVRR